MFIAKVKFLLLLLALTCAQGLTAAAIKVATFNAEWLGCPNQRPDDDELQMQNVATLIRTMNVDVIALQEVTDNPTRSLSIVLAHLGSAYAGSIVPYSPSTCAQSEAIIYKKSRATLTETPRLMSDAGTSNAWASGRYPVEFKLKIDGTTNLTFINLHAKAMSDATSYSRRVEASKGLKTLLDGAAYRSQNLIVLGDFNDNIYGSTCSSCGSSPYKNFVDDNASYRFLSADLDAMYSQIDHIMISNELFAFYKSGSTMRETKATQSIADYYTTTSDHIPVSAEFELGKRTPTLNLPGIYTKQINEASFALPAMSSENQPIIYAIDSGTSVTISGTTATLQSLGTTRVRAQVAETGNADAAEKTFRIVVVANEEFPRIVAQPEDQHLTAYEQTAYFSVSAVGTSITYQWLKNGASIDGATSFALTVKKANNKDIARYSCRVSNSKGSVTSSEAQLCIVGMCPPTTSAGKSRAAKGIRIFPNPSYDGQVVVDYGYIRAGYRIEIYSIGGTLMKSVVADGKSTNVDVASLPAGTYVVKVRKWRGQFVKK